MNIQKLVALIGVMIASHFRADAEPAKEAAPEGLQARMQSVIQTATAMGAKDFAASLAYLEAEGRKLQTEFPQRPEPYEILMDAATFSDADKARALAHEIAESKAASAELKRGAEGLLKNLDRLGKSFSLKFTAVDGRPVDIETLKGKVVLIDYWATWCPPCLAMMPYVKSTYQELQPRGFEIVGISCDDDKAKLERFLAREKVPWPQYFDSNGRDNQFAKAFDVRILPTMWLVDKNGLLRHLNAGNNLGEKVKALLAE